MKENGLNFNKKLGESIMIATGINVFQTAQMLAELNEQQRVAAMTIYGRVLVLAGAGSGKTKTLTTRIANMMTQGVKPSRIFCATFTNKAACEMKERLAKVVGEESASYVWMGTFHSLCVRMLRKHGHLLGYGQKDGRCNFIIYDTYDVLKLIERIYKIMNVDYKPGLALNYIDTAKNNLWTPEYCLYNVADTPQNEVMAQVYHRYQLMMKEANAMDFGDLIGNMVTLLTEHDEARNYWQNKFEFVMADEYQDTNPATFQLLKELAAPHFNIFVVGDHDQSIYGFRGADINIILNFEKHFAPCTILMLETNYRSTKNVVYAGNSLIANNPSPYNKVLRSSKGDGELINVVETGTEYAEAAYIATVMKQAVISGKRDWKDFAILYRAGFQSAPFEQLFVHNFIPFKVIGGTSFFEREEIKDLTAYLRVIFNRKDDQALLRIVNKPARGIGKTSESKIEEFANNKNVSVHRALKTAEDIEGIKKPAAGKIKAFLHTLDHLEEEYKKGRSFQSFVNFVLDHSGLLGLYRERASKEKDGHERLDNLEEFVRLVSHYESENPDKSLEEFMSEMSLVSDYGKEKKDEENVVKLLTMHASKGLEFPSVFLVGWNEQVFPSWRSMSNQDIQEERRLAYVGITRAEEELTVTYALQRQRSNGKGVQVFHPSRFIEELPEDIVNKINLSGSSS
jgi:DNA helicase II / ATP-dependent DNA helicase PcrA